MAITSETQAQLKQAFVTLKPLSSTDQSGVISLGLENGVEYIVVGGSEDPSKGVRLGSDGTIAYPDQAGLGEFTEALENEAQTKASEALVQIQPLIKNVQSAEKIASSQSVREMGMEVLREYKFPQDEKSVAASREASQQLSKILRDSQEKQDEIARLQLPQDSALQFYAGASGRILGLGLNEQDQAAALQNLSNAFVPLLEGPAERTPNVIEDFSKFSNAVKDFVSAESEAGRNETKQVAESLCNELLPKTQKAAVNAIQNSMDSDAEPGDVKPGDAEPGDAEPQGTEKENADDLEEESEAGIDPFQQAQASADPQQDEEEEKENEESIFSKKNLYKLGALAITLAACFVPVVGGLMLAGLIAPVLTYTYIKLDEAGFFEKKESEKSPKKSSDLPSKGSLTNTGQEAEKVAEQTKEELEKQKEKLKDEQAKLGEFGENEKEQLNEKQNQQSAQLEVQPKVNQDLQGVNPKEEQSKNQQPSSNKQNTSNIREGAKGVSDVSPLEEADVAKNQRETSKQKLSTEEEARRKQAKQLAEDARKFVKDAIAEGRFDSVKSTFKEADVSSYSSSNIPTANSANSKEQNKGQN